MMARPLIVLAILFPLAGCARQQETSAPLEKPFAEMSAAEQCAKLLELSGNYYLNPGERSAAYETARNRGCMGKPQPQTVIVR